MTDESFCSLKLLTCFFITSQWMFGVLLWELVTRASLPYEEATATELPDLLRAGYRLAQPRSCPDDL